MAQSAYIHIPFCAHKCDFCDFAAFAGLDQLSEEYKDVVIKEIEERLREIPNAEPLKTIFFGGGTPGYVPPAHLAAIIEALERYAGLDLNSEICLETTPQTISTDKCQEWLKAGIKRISIGIESLNDNELQALSRGHCREDAIAGFERAREGGFENIAADLMYGLPEQTLQSWERTLDDLISLRPDHISAYGLTLAENSPLLMRYPKESSAYPDEATFVQMYDLLVEKCESAGLIQYEIANFARPGYESRHNLTYWRNQEYLAFGVSAHRYVNGRRSSNFRSLKKYMREYTNNETEELIDEEGQMKETIFLGLRLREGLDLGLLSERFGQDLRTTRAKELDKLLSAELVELSSNRLTLTQKGVLISNTVMSELI